jgi:hypothetical protein
VSGKTIVLETQPYTIIGVLPAHFSFPYPGVDVWLTRPEEWPPMAAKSRRMSPFLSLFGRVKPQLDMAQANAEMTVVQRRYAIANPGMMDAKPKSPVVVRPLKDRLVANVRSMLWMLLGAVTFVLLITCANVASLMLARAAARNREFAVRAALGASRGRLAGQLLAESILLSVAGGALGVFLAAEGVRAIPLMTAFNLPRSGEVHLDWLVLAFACVLSIGTGVLFGLAPAASAVRPDLMSVLRGKGEATRQGLPYARPVGDWTDFALGHFADRRGAADGKPDSSARRKCRIQSCKSFDAADFFAPGSLRHRTEAIRIL